VYQDRKLVSIGDEPVRIAQILALARGECSVALNRESASWSRIGRSAALLERVLSGGGTVYGVTTGFGESVTTHVPRELAEDLPLNLLRFHGCGTGRILDEEETAAVVAVRLASLSRGYGGVREVVVERLCGLLNHRVLPRIPCEGSVGASGDLTPLSYVAAVLVGEREATFRGEVLPAATALERAGLASIRLMPKESLALMNGTSVMTALGCIAWERAWRLGRFASAITAMVSDTLRGNPVHFDDRIFQLKPHPGQALVARWIREDIEYDRTKTYQPARLQDRYSVRCGPHVIGVLVDALPVIKETLETELNGVNDNPIIDPDTEVILHGGNFYGGHVGFAMDNLKTAVANLADLVDRQLALLCDPHINNGLPANLVAVEGPASRAHHGFKAMQISTSALAAEALKLTMPASVFSRSTENHNQDKVPMGTIAARDCLRVLELTEQVAAIGTLAVCQAVDIRKREGCHGRALAMHEAVRREVPMNTADRRMDFDIYAVLDLYRSGKLPIGELELP
jgi:histidine ammonia-lyase